MSNDADLIRKMTEAYIGRGAAIFETVETGMARVLAVVRAHDATPARRVPVWASSHDGYLIIAVCNDGTIYRGWWESEGKFIWRDQLPPLPQPGDDV